LEIIEQPDRLILLRDQFRLVEAAARELGDDALPARLSTAAGLDGLGLYGRHMLSFERLGDAITIAYQAYGSLLQASTEMELEISGGWARWSYLITAPLALGRQKNELLAFGYMLDFLRRFLGPHWTPDRIELPGPVQGRARIEALFGSNLAVGDRAAIVFPAELLDALNPAPVAARGVLPAIVPDTSDTTDIVRHMIALGRLTGDVGIEAIAGRMAMTRRTLQRRLAAAGTSFAALSQQLKEAEARAALRRHDTSITAIALALGYSDAAHFTRAFQRWTDQAPSRWRGA